jgi:hypothetical protein
MVCRLNGMTGAAGGAAPAAENSAPAGFGRALLLARFMALPWRRLLLLLGGPFC